MSDTPFTTIGDEPVEARIVAWVLGEASTLEAAELERLCAERPELLVFKRRMLALHGLLTEAQTARPDEGWKLPPEKRKALDELFGEEKPLRLEVEKEKRIRHSGRRAFLAIAACLMLTAIILSLIGTGGGGKTRDALSSTREFQKPNAAPAPAERDQRLEQLRKTIRDQEDKVEERRKVLATMTRTKGIIYKDDDSLQGADQYGEAMKSDAREEAIRRGLDTQDYAEATSDFESERELLQKLKLKLIDEEISNRVEGQGLAMNEAPAEASGLEGTKRKSAPAKPAAPVVPAGEVASADTMDQLARSDADPFADDSPDLSRLSARQPAGQGAGYGSGSGGGGAPKDAGRIAGEKSQLAERQLEGDRKAPAAMTQPARSRKANADTPQDELLAGRDKAMESAAPEEAMMVEQEPIAETESSSRLAATPVVPGKATEETAATEDPYSTFSLNISDASFQIAQAALAKGERPDPAGIKVEQFYNAVDYGDPAPSAGEPVAVSIEQSTHPVIPGRNLVRVALKTAAAGRAASQPLRLTLLVDQSGSMVREDRRAAMDQALAGLAGLLTEQDQVSVVGFSRTPRLLADSMPGNQAGKLAGLVNQSASEGGTNLEEAIKLGEQMAERNQLAGAQNRAVLFTDGAANLGNADPVRLAEKVKQLRQKGIAFDIAGIAADGLNDGLLGELARNGNGRYYVVGKGADDNFAKQLAGAFRPAAENVKVQVRFNPERVGRYKLIGFEKDRLKTEDFRNDAVDAAELAAEEAGVAIYQVEPLPGGNGELGEVSVRFRDAASGQMVERTWTIPHDRGAPAIDRATPSMQLAVLSMLAAEKLKGGPLSDAIDFQQLAAPAASVKQFYGNTGRAGEMLRMVDALK